MERQRPENLTKWKTVGYEYTAHDTERGQIWVYSEVLRALGVDDPDGQRVYIAVEALDDTQSEAPKYCGEVTMRSGQEIYGADIARAVEPNSRVRVMVSVPVDEKDRPGGRRARFGWSDGGIVVTERPGETRE